MRTLLFIIWILIGCCFFLSGCHASLTAEKLAATVTVDNPVNPVPKTIVEIHEEKEKTDSQDPTIPD